MSARAGSGAARTRTPGRGGAGRARTPGAFARAVTIAEMQGRELLRRRAAMALFALLPAAFLLSIPADEDYAVMAGAIGVSWAVSAAGMFSILGWRRVDPRLSLLGARPRDGMLARIVASGALAAALVALYAPLILARSTVIEDATLFVVALAVLAAVSVPLGLLIGALVPRELEGTLVLIGVVGIESSIPPETAGAAVLPLYGPLELLFASGGISDGALAGAVAHSFVASALMTAAAFLLWARRVRAAAPATSGVA